MSEPVADLAKLSSNQRKVAAALLSGQSNSQAAVTAGVTVRTVERYLHDPDFQAVINDGAGKALAAASQRFNLAISLATEAIIELAQGADKDATRLRAASLVVDNALRLGLMVKASGAAAINDPDFQTVLSIMKLDSTELQALIDNLDSAVAGPEPGGDDDD